MNERKKLILITVSVFVWASSLLVWGGWWALKQRDVSGGVASSEDGQAEASETRAGGSVSIPVYGEIPHKIRPLSPESGTTENVLPLIYESLVQQQDDGSIGGLLAEHWSVADGGKTVTVQLREGVEWHDGEPFTVADVIYTYHKLAEPDYEGPYRKTVQSIAGAKDVQSGEAAVIEGIEHRTSGGEETITLHMDQPIKDSMEILQIPIIPRHLHYQSEGEPELKQPVGTGPYQMMDRQEQHIIELERFARYWNEEQSNLKRISFRLMSMEEAVAQFKEGELDVLPQMDASIGDALLDESRRTPIQKSGDVFHYIAFNPNQKMWNDRKLRAVVGQTLDKQQIVQKWLKGFGVKVDTPRGTQVQHTDQKAWEAGLDQLKNKTIRLHYTSEWVDRDELAIALQKQWESSGLKVKLVEHKNVKKLTEAIQSGEADLFLMTDWVRAQPDDLYNWWDQDNLQQWIRWPANKVKTALKKASETDGKERERLIREWDELFVKQMPLVPLVRPKMLYFVAENLHGVEVEDFRPDFIDVRNWWVEKSVIAKNNP